MKYHTIVSGINRILEIASALDKAGFIKHFKVYDFARVNGNLISGMDMKPKAYKYYLALIKE